MYKDMIGRRFGYLEVKEYVYTKNSHAHWKCVCHRCGEEAIISGANMRSGNSRGCAKCRNKIPEKIRNKIRQHYKNGHTQVETAKHFGINRHTVRTILHEQKS